MRRRPTALVALAATCLASLLGCRTAATHTAAPPRPWPPVATFSILGYDPLAGEIGDRKSTRLNSSHQIISYAVFCLKKKKKQSPFHVNTQIKQPKAK